jgi:hypothetical protein
MHRALLVILAVGACQAGDSMEAFGLRWSVPVAADWKLEQLEGMPVLSLLVPRPSERPRRPTQFALAETKDYSLVTVELEAKKEPQALRNRRNSLIIVYAYKDADHFNYAHMSDDTGSHSPHHNGIFHVDGGDRVRISSTEGPATLTEEKWYKLRLVFDGKTGVVDVFVDGKSSPSLHAVEKTFTAGRIGIGSFFDTGQFRKFSIKGK